MSSATPNTTAIPKFVLQACRLLESSDSPPSLAALSAQVGVSSAHLHRVFVRCLGMSPKEYASACRSQRLQQALSHAPSVTQAMYEAGFGSSSRFYANSEQALGMSVQRYRQGGRHETLFFALGRCSVGEVLVASSRQGLVSILLGDQPEQLLQLAQARFPHASWQGGVGQYEQLAAQVLGFLDTGGHLPAFPLDLRGTVFQRQVWHALQSVPAGTVLTYSQLAERLGRPAAVRAVASACAANPLAIVVPCHRVIRKDGGLGGYAWGLARKQQLLASENAQLLR